MTIGRNSMLAFILVFILVITSSGLAEKLPPGTDSLVYKETKLIASDFGTEEYFGWSIDVSGDRAVIGAPYVDCTDGINCGAAYIFVRSGDEWVEEQILVAPDAQGNDNFGISVAISSDTVLVGAPYADVSGEANQGSAYIYWYDSGVWILQDWLTASDGAASDYFGISVALDGDTALVGAQQHEGNYTYQGAVYAFTRSGYTWNQQQELRATDGASGDKFGTSVDLDGDNALVGAPFDDNYADLDVGSAYFFTRSGSVWSQQDKITADDGAEGDNFGYSVALDGLTALIGAPNDTLYWYHQGTAYVFRKLFDWSQLQILMDSFGEANANFGNSVALSGNTALVTAYLANVEGSPRQGEAILYKFDGAYWGWDLLLTASDGVAEARYGIDCALMGGTPWVTVPFADIGETIDAGAVYVYDPIYQMYIPMVVRNSP